MKTYGLFIGGEWGPAASGESFADVNPYTGETYARAAKGDRSDVRRAVAAAEQAFPAWAAAPAATRERVLLKLADLLEAELPAMRDIMVSEAGCTYGKAVDEVQRTLGMVRAAAGDARRVMGETIPSDSGKFSFTIRQPLGVVGVISPWNFPLYLAAKKVCLALAVGNTVVFKPASETPVTGCFFTELAERAGLPKGVLNLVTGPGSVVGDELVVHPRVRLVSVTGESATGKRVAEKAASQFKRVALELGGNNPMLVLADADVDYAVSAALFGCFQNSGQNCMATERVIVAAPIYAEFCQKLARRAAALRVGNPADPATQIGPLVNQQQYDWVVGHVAEAVSQGARLLCGGKGEGLTYWPTVVADVTAGMRLFHEETFGPVAAVTRAADTADAIALANQVNMGLSAGVITRDVGQGLQVARRLEVGLCHINDSSIYSEPHIPFGGVKESGYSREGAGYSFEDLTELKWITVQEGTKRFLFD